MAPDELEDLEIRVLLDAIHARYGYEFRRYSQDSMKRRVQRALVKSGAENYGELQHRILSDPSFWNSLLVDFTVQVSEVFRDPPFHVAFRERVVPLLRTYPELKFWHAGSAAGEEAYSTAILLSEENLYDRAQIYVTDVDPSAVERAREGVYPEDRLDVFTDNYRKAGGKRVFADYYASAYSRVTFRESLRKNMFFFQHDLAIDHSLGDMHVIFCRNVLIYFGPELRARVLGVFAKGLYRGGFLCLGANEQLPEVARADFDEFVPEARIYRMRGEA